MRTISALRIDWSLRFGLAWLGLVGLFIKYLHTAFRTSSMTFLSPSNHKHYHVVGYWLLVASYLLLYAHNLILNTQIQYKRMNNGGWRESSEKKMRHTKPPSEHNGQNKSKPNDFAVIIMLLEPHTNVNEFLQNKTTFFFVFLLFVVALNNIWWRQWQRIESPFICNYTSLYCEISSS